jgi:hypothetical protein
VPNSKFLRQHERLSDVVDRIILLASDRNAYVSWIHWWDRHDADRAGGDGMGCGGLPEDHA